MVLGFEFDGEEQHECKKYLCFNNEGQEHDPAPNQTSTNQISYSNNLFLYNYFDHSSYYFKKKKKNTVDVGLTSLHLWVSITNYDVGLSVSPRSPNLLHVAQLGSQNCNSK